MLQLTVLPQTYSIVRFCSDTPLPTWVFASTFYSITRTDEELSIVCETSLAENNGANKIEPNWKILKVLGPLDFSLTGILSKISASLSDGGVSIFAISTFDTDYILVKSAVLEKAVSLLNAMSSIEVL